MTTVADGDKTQDWAAGCNGEGRERAVSNGRDSGVVMMAVAVEEVSVLDSNIPIPHIQPVGWPGTERNVASPKTHLLTKVGFWIQSVLSVLLGRGSKEESSAKHVWMTFLIENNELNLMQTKRGLNGCVRKCVPRKILHNLICLGACSEEAQIASSDGSNVPYWSQCTGCWLNWIHLQFQPVCAHMTTLIPTAISCDVQDIYSCWGFGLLYAGMPQWCVVHLTTNLDLVSIFKIQRCRTFPREYNNLEGESPLSAVPTATLFCTLLLAAYEDSIWLNWSM